MRWLDQLTISPPIVWKGDWFRQWFQDVMRQLGKRVVEVKIDSTGKTAQAHLRVLTADPTTLDNGDFWINSTAGKFRARIGGVTVDLN